MREATSRRGVILESRSRLLTKKDLENFDYIVVMDHSNYQNVLNLDSNNKFKHKIFHMMDFASNWSDNEVPDPYYGGEKGFDRVIDMVEDAAQGLLKKIRADYNI